MHLPDPFLDGKTMAAAAGLAAAGVGVALWQTRTRLPPRRVPLMGLSAAFVFAAQMINFPVAGGTTGHLIGGTLVAVLLGPSAAVIVLTAVLVVQCFIYADGGVLSLGANVLLMGIVNALAGYYVYRGVRRVLPGERGRLTAVAFAAWCGTVVASAVCAGMLVTSGKAPASTAFPAMIGVHMLIGIGESLITTLAVAAVWKARPDLLEPDAAAAVPATFRTRGAWEFVAYGMLLALTLAVFVSPFAASAPDGLERVAEDLKFADAASTGPLLESPIPDYEVPGINSAAGATALAGLIGTVVVFGLSLLLARVLVPRRAVVAGPSADADETDSPIAAG